MEARGILSEKVRVLYENGRPVGEEDFCETGLARPCTTQNTKSLGVRFSALLTKDGTERLELARV
jgi:hypothetical protein